MSKKVVTLYLNAENYDELKEYCNKLGIKVSVKIDEWIRQGLKELIGKDYKDLYVAEYEDLKRKHNKLTKDFDVIRTRLEKRKVYDRLKNLVEKLGLDFEDYRNVDEIAPKILSEWDDAPGDAHQFISLLEIVREKRQVEHRLKEIRNARVKNSLSEEKKEQEPRLETNSEKPRRVKEKNPLTSPSPVPLTEEEEPEREEEETWSSF